MVPLVVRRDTVGRGGSPSSLLDLVGCKGALLLHEVGGTTGSVSERGDLVDVFLLEPAFVRWSKNEGYYPRLPPGAMREHLQSVVERPGYGENLPTWLVVYFG
jgi:hypothetical protein